jgi:hypothetical protein
MQVAETKRFHKVKDPGLLWKAPSLAPIVPVFLLPKFHLQGKCSVYRRENLFLKALIVLAIIGAIFFTAGFLGS